MVWYLAMLKRSQDVRTVVCCARSCCTRPAIGGG